MRALRNYLITTILLLSLLSIYIPIHYDMSYPMDVGPQFDERIRPLYIRILNEQRPEVFLIGDSMLGDAVEKNAIENLHNKKVHMSSLPGTASTIWYSIIKNNIVIAKHKPEYLVVFFRDSMMTVPGYRVTGRYLELVDEFASPDDKLLIERAYINQMTPLDRFINAYMPLYGARWIIREGIDSQIRYALGNHVLDCDQTCMDYAMEFVFVEGNLDLIFLSEAINTADSYLYKEDVLDFENQINKSFLPEIIRLCKENNIQLIFVRMPILRFEDTGTNPPELDNYIQGLSAYLEENDIPFLDFDQKKLQAEYFRDTLHLNEHGKELFTQELIQALDSIFK